MNRPEQLAQTLMEIILAQKEIEAAWESVTFEEKSALLTEIREALGKEPPE